MRGAHKILQRRDPAEMHEGAKLICPGYLRPVRNDLPLAPPYQKGACPFGIILGPGAGTLRRSWHLDDASTTIEFFDCKERST